MEYEGGSRTNFGLIVRYSLHPIDYCWNKFYERILIVL